MFNGMYEMLIIVIFEFFVVLFAMGWDFASGYYKAKIRGEDRNSYGLRRTVSKFILYAGSICIASGIDSISFVCHFWEFVHMSPLMRIPVVTSIIAVFILVTEVRSIWEKADAKQRRQAGKAAELIGSVFNKEMLKNAISEVLISAKDKENKK
ncbi:phage holin family protein [uncultured Parabacteroides sp.]|uniref:phage holin family protein n=1 Tax=uncultured Parabacteroides sp. TaxID=512312 RepID=UPI0025E5A640|nr:phage holin family protein [uncultured Parabacteroides sp.]